jgi:hypothetical protein
MKSVYEKGLWEARKSTPKYGGFLRGILAGNFLDRIPGAATMLSPAGEVKIGFSAFSAGKTHPLPSLSKKSHAIGNVGVKTI